MMRMYEATSAEVRRAFPVGARVLTTEPAYLMRGKTSRCGTVVGYCHNSGAGQYIRVTWDGWKPQSSIAVNSERFRRL